MITAIMGYKIRVFPIIALTLLLPFSQGDNPDDDRAYEFGFTIEGQQHRHEKKDVRGIIEGEFGFITADGIYHVTVYATDENGNFRILSMKNIRVSPPLDGSGFAGGKNNINQTSNKKRNDFYTTKAPFTTRSTIKPACAGCGYITTSTPSSPNTGVEKSHTLHSAFLNKDSPSFPNKKQGYKSSKVSITSDNNSYNDTKARLTYKLNNKVSSINGANQVTNIGISSLDLPQNKIPLNQNIQLNSETLSNKYQTYKDAFSNPQNQLIANEMSKHTADITLRNPPENPDIMVTNGVIKIKGNKDIPIVDKYPGMKNGLPDGINEKDITDILYKFNYIVGFHGHYETGYKNGAKVGGYFVNGRDGISRVVTYVADERGYRPKFKMVNLGLDSSETPKEDSEKTFGLKSFEFVWFPIK